MTMYSGRFKKWKYNNVIKNVVLSRNKESLSDYNEVIILSGIKFNKAQKAYIIFNNIMIKF